MITKTLRKCFEIFTNSSHFSNSSFFFLQILACELFIAFYQILASKLIKQIRIVGLQELKLHENKSVELKKTSSFHLAGAQRKR